MHTPRRLPRPAASMALLLGLGLAGSAPLSAQSFAGRRDTSLTLSASAVVDVTLRTGRVIVRGIEGTTGTVRGGGQRYELRATGVGMTLNARDMGGDRDDAPLVLEVPRGARVLVNTASADVRLQDLRGDIEVHTANGDIVAEDVDGRLVVETLSGDVTVDGAPAGVRITSTSGDVIVRGLRGDADLRTTSGDVRVDGERLTRVLVENFNGDVTIDGTLTADARVQVRTHNGDVSVRIPGGAQGRLELSTISGDLSASGPLTLLPDDARSSAGGRSTRRYEFGGGGPLQIDISTFNGDVRLVRGIRS